jgi:hypothetical protein
MHSNADRRLYRIFSETFFAADVAEPLPSIDEASVHGYSIPRAVKIEADILGVRRNGHVFGYLETSSDASRANTILQIGEQQIIDERLPLADLVVKLREQEYLFVHSLGEVNGIVCRNDLQKPAGRMWLFGMVTMLEVAIERAIDNQFPNDGWTELISRERLEKAKEIQKLRAEAGTAPTLTSCLQLADKGQILVKDEKLRQQSGFESQNKGSKQIRRLESLRNLLAHSQDIVTNDWETIVGLAEDLDSILAVVSG